MLLRELFTIEFGTENCTDISLSLKKMEVFKNIQENTATDHWLRGVPEGLLNGDPIKYKGLLYFARNCSMHFQGPKTMPEEQYQNKIEDKRMRKLVKEYKLLIDKPEEMYSLACNLDYNTDYNYVTKSDAKLQVTQLKRSHLMSKFSKLGQAY